jgi:hypothetical protein
MNVEGEVRKNTMGFIVYLAVNLGKSLPNSILGFPLPNSILGFR